MTAIQSALVTAGLVTPGLAEALKNINEDGPTAAQRGIDTKHFLNDTSSVPRLDGLPVDLDQTQSLITNVRERIRELDDIDERAAYFATNAICTSMGYTVCNALAWQHRKRNQFDEVPSIDIFNDEFGAEGELLANRTNTEEQGHAQLPVYDAIQLAGVYKQLLLNVKSSRLSTDFPPRMPNAIIHELQQPRVDPRMAKAMEQLNTRITASMKTGHLIDARAKLMNENFQTQKAERNKVETEFILAELQGTRPASFDLFTWIGMPLWMRYKYAVSVQKQIVTAFTRELLLPDGDIGKQDKLSVLLEEMQDELLVAAKHSEVKLAFALERLTDAHRVEGKKVEPAVEEVLPS